MSAPVCWGMELGAAGTCDVAVLALQRNGADSKAKMPNAYITGSYAQLKMSQAAAAFSHLVFSWAVGNSFCTQCVATNLYHDGKNRIG